MIKVHPQVAAASNSPRSSLARTVKAKRRSPTPVDAVVGDGVTIRDSLVPGAGLGLFATRDFEKGELITKYEGPVITREDALRHRQENVANASHFLSMPGDRFSVVMGVRDALLLKQFSLGGGSMANTIGDSARINAEFVCVPGAEGLGGCAYLKVKRNGERIVAGDEIFVDYTKGGREMMGLTLH